jgi:Lrp/AsnC family transcriptional regulator, regulator for asnA, asnC and gidA
MARPVNDTDRAIIRLLQQNARMPYAEISRATGIPESTVRRRIDRLQERGIIEFAMVADPARLGFDVRVLVGLKVELAQLDQIAATLADLDEVLFAAFLTGAYDIEVHAVVRSQAALVRFLTRKLASIPGIKSVETFTMPYVIKPTTAWVLPDARGTDVPADEAGDDDEPAETRPRRRRATRARAATGDVAGGE